MRPGLPHSPPSQARTSPLSTWPFCNIRLSLGNFLPKFLPFYKRAIRNRLRNTSLRSSPALAPLGQSRKTVHAALAPKLLRMTRQFKNFRELPGILCPPGWTSLTSRRPIWLPFSPKHRISLNLPKAGSNAAPITAPASRAISTPIPAKLSTLTPSRSQAKALHRLLPMNLFAVWSPRTTFVAGIVSSWAGSLRAKPPPPPNWSSGFTSSRDIPLTLEQAEPYAIYFFQSSMLRVLTREGIRPKRKPYGSSSLLKIQPTDTWGPVGTSQLRGRSDACLLIDMHASLESGTQWIQHASDGCYGTDQVPLTPQFLLAAFRFSASGTEPFWSAPTSAQPAQPARASRAPATFFTHTDTVEAAQIDTRADMRLDAHLSAPPVIPIPDEDDDLHEVPPDIEMPLSTAVEDAFAHLERAIDNMHAEHPTHPGFDPLFYLALSNLPLTYPWPILTVDLKSFLPLMDRHVMTHLVAGRSAVNPQYQHPAPVLASFFTDLAHTIAHHLLAPLNSQYMRPNLPPRIFTSEFWHAHFNYAALRTDPSLAAVGSMDGLAGDQLCQWNSVAPDSIIPPTTIRGLCFGQPSKS